MRVGTGYDSHRFGKGRPLVIGGVDIPFPRGLVGHSDADVLVHAVIDAVLGAAVLGDIGQHFPDSDESWRDVSSLELAAQTAKLLAERGFTLSNIDATVILEEPRLADHIAAMRANLAEAFGVSVEVVSVKATTNERMGAIGQGDGAAALAVALVDEAR